MQHRRTTFQGDEGKLRLYLGGVFEASSKAPILFLFRSSLNQPAGLARQFACLTPQGRDEACLRPGPLELGSSNFVFANKESSLRACARSEQKERIYAFSSLLVWLLTSSAPSTWRRSLSRITIPLMRLISCPSLKKSRVGIPPTWY